MPDATSSFAARGETRAVWMLTRRALALGALLATAACGATASTASPGASSEEHEARSFIEQLGAIARATGDRRVELLSALEARSFSGEVEVARRECVSHQRHLLALGAPPVRGPRAAAAVEGERATLATMRSPC